MEQGDDSSSVGLDCSEGAAEPGTTEPWAASGGDKDYDDILELNQFDGLPYSSRFYTLLRERKELPVWKAKREFMDVLTKEQFVNVSGSARTGRSSQVVWKSIRPDDSLPVASPEPKPADPPCAFCRSHSGVPSTACLSTFSMAWWSAARPSHSRRWTSP